MYFTMTLDDSISDTEMLNWQTMLKMSFRNYMIPESWYKILQLYH